MKEKLKNFGGALKSYVMLLVLVVIVFLFQAITGGTLLTSTNVFNLINQNAYIMILAIGMLLCILTGGNVDLSVGSVIGFSGATMATMMQNGINPYLALLAGLAIGILVGAWNGFWIAYIKIPPFITTMAGMFIFRGATMMVLTGGKTISPLPEQFTGLASGYIGTSETSGTICFSAGIVLALLFVLSQVLSYLRQKRNGYLVESPVIMGIRTVVIAAGIIWLFTTMSVERGIPIVLITVGVVALIYNYITQRTVLGRHLYALGGNAKAARLSGVNNDKIMFLVYTNMGFLSAVAAVAYCSRINAATAAAGTGSEMDAIAACFIGGAAATGGIGTVGATLVGALIMGVMNNGMSILGLGYDMQQAVKGVVLIIAIAFDVITKQKTLVPIMERIRRKLSSNK